MNIKELKRKSWLYLDGKKTIIFNLMMIPLVVMFKDYGLQLLTITYIVNKILDRITQKNKDTLDRALKFIATKG